MEIEKVLQGEKTIIYLNGRLDIQTAPEFQDELDEIIGEEKTNELTTVNPTLVLNNKKIDIREPHKVELTIKEKFSLYTEDAVDKIKKLLKK